MLNGDQKRIRYLLQELYTLTDYSPVVVELTKEIENVFDDCAVLSEKFDIIKCTIEDEEHRNFIDHNKIVLNDDSASKIISNGDFDGDHYYGPCGGNSIGRTAKNSSLHGKDIIYNIDSEELDRVISLVKSIKNKKSEDEK